MTTVEAPARWLVTCRRCGWSTSDASELSASILAMLHKIRSPYCCADGHVCLHPAAQRWTPLGDMRTVAVGACVDCCLWGPK